MINSGPDDIDAFEAWEDQSLSARAMAARPTPWLDDLNPPQREAAESLDGPVLVLAGAGTGKTRALTCRIAQIMATGRARPHQILAVTFTNKAAREMKSRLGKLVGPAVEGMPWLGTFHSLCVKMLRRHAELAGLENGFTILDTDDQLRLIKQILTAEEIDHKRWPPRQLAGLIDRWKNRGLTPDKLPVEEASGFNRQGGRLYALYQQRLRTLNAVDFGDLLLHVVTILQKHPDVLATWRDRFRYILVDEYQDTNVAQYLWLRLLAGGAHNICCVGDDDQSIYGWRGAEVGNILRFEKDFPGAKVIRLEQNYRSTPHILAAASAVIHANENRLGKSLWTEEATGEKLRLIGHWDGDEEARWIGEEIEALSRGARGLDPVSPDHMAILVRASFQMRSFEDRFLTIGMSYRVIGGPRFYERLEIRDALAYFRCASNPTDGMAFGRIVNTPKRGLGDKAQSLINQMAREREVGPLEGARLLLASGGVTGRAAKSLGKLVADLERWQDQARAGMNHVELAEIILDESGYTGMWKAEKSPDAAGRLENLKELVKALDGFENLEGFLEHIALVMDNEQEDGQPKVSIMTLHAAKGLEFPCVFLPGWEDGLFPSQRSMDESGLAGLEEERRLAYVGLTRAEKLLTVSFAANRAIHGRWQSALPSRFIDELPAAHVEVMTPPGLYGGTFGAAGQSMRGGPAAEPQASRLETAASGADAYNSPGWRRMQANAGQRGLRTPSEARHLVIDAQAVSPHAVGDKVFHQKFGYGVVESVEGDKLSILFDKAGTKKVVGSYVTAADAVPF
jgi:DNA helicase-2/ATP-dependent DNA helicase PcrA